MLQKQFSIDDGIVLFGVLCLVVSMVLLINFIDDLFLMKALEGDKIPENLPVNFLKRVVDFERYATGALVLTWCVIVCVKFSYLFLFRKLIDRLHPMRVYWWFAAVFNGLVSIYGLVVYAAVRPWYCTTTSCERIFLIEEDLLMKTFSAMFAWERSGSIARFRHQSDGS